MKRVKVAGFAAAFACAIGVGPATAQVPPDPNNHDFWEDVIEPHNAEITQLMAGIDMNLAQIDVSYNNDVDPTGQIRQKMLSDMYGRLRYARKLSPQNVQVLSRLGRVADQLGKTKQAIEALEAASAVTGADKAPSEVTGPLGMIYLRMGDLDAAVRYLRMAQEPATTVPGAELAIGLATALAMRGQMGDAIDVLTGAQNVAQVGYYDNAQGMLAFSLAVFYDRDEQRSEAFTTMDHMQSALQQSYVLTLQNYIGSIRYSPPEEKYYYEGLLYESGGNWTEARAAWALYAASNGQWRARALDHIAAIDAERKAHPGAKTAPTPTPRRPRRPVP